MTQAQDSGPRRGLLPRYTLKDGDTFLLADALGDIHDREDGLFTNDTRMLSRFELSIAQRPVSLLGAAVSEDNTTFSAHLTNRPLPALGEHVIPQGVIHIERCRLLLNGRLYERLRLTNFSNQAAELPVRLVFAADFVDIFEIQGHVRAARGQLLRPVVGDRGVRLAYRGLDDLVRTTQIEFSRKPGSLTADRAEFLIELPAHAVEHLYTEIGATEEVPPSQERYERAAHTCTQSARHRREAGGYLETPGRLFNQWLAKSHSDLALLTTPLSTGPYPYAGIPWFSTQFGRDAVITALQTLWLDPRLAAGVLRFLASTQATETSAFRDSEPGKIMHEMRRGEMARLREIPFGCYYGAVDTTPLFLMLAGAYETRTGDRSLIDEIWPHLQAAAAWIESRLEQSRTGFLDYARGEKSGLANQAWKDSQDSIFHADGRLPKGPIAVVEVQGYACAALEAMAQLGSSREDEAGRSNQWRTRAQRLREAIEQRFWIPRLSFYAIALDGDGEPCCVQGSNAGHLLYCGVPSPQHANAVATRLLSEGFCTGWGIRTLLQGEQRYNPMSYHNGSVWPHDTSICASGIARYGQRDCVLKILADVFEAANHFSMRLPELYCGFPRAPGQGPVPYPVACLPQAWASGSLFMLLQAALGIRIDGARKEVHIERPLLPEGIESLRVRQLPVGETRIDIEFHRLGKEVGAFPVGHAQGGVNVLLHL
jgi:glycogen debranching enzyme